MSTTFTIAEASKLLGISERAVKHYRAIYTTEVIKEGSRVYLTQKFLDKVKKTRSLDSNTITDSRTKAELLKEIEVFKDHLKEVQALKKELSATQQAHGEDIETFSKELSKYKEEIDLLKKELFEGQEEIAVLTKKLKDKKDIIKDYKNSLVFEKPEEGLKVEVFTLQDYAIFEERLNEWKTQRKEIELRIEQNAELKEDKNYLKARNEYLETSNNKILEQHEKLIEAIQQRNRIEAVEKGVIPKEPKEI